MTGIMADPFEVSFTGDLTHNSLDKDGRLTLTFAVDLKDKYAAMPISDIKGKKFHVTVTSKSHRVVAGEEGIATNRARVMRRQLDRKIQMAKARKESSGG